MTKNKIDILNRSIAATDEASAHSDADNSLVESCVVGDSCPESLVDIKGLMNREQMTPINRMKYWMKVWEEWSAKGMDVSGVEQEIALCKRSLDYQLSLKKWQLNYMTELQECNQELVKVKSGKNNLRPMEYNKNMVNEIGEKMNNCFYLKVGSVENKMLGQLLDDAEDALVAGGYIFRQEGVSLKSVMGYRYSDEVSRPVKWQGTLSELHELIRYLIDDVRVMDCPSGYNIRWQIAVNCFVDRRGQEIKLKSLSRSSSIKHDDAERLHKCIPKMLMRRG